MEKAIIEYEKTRQKVVRLKKERNMLLEECNLFESNKKMSCLSVAYSEFCRDSYEGKKLEFLASLEDMHDDGECCDRCLESYRLKVVGIPNANRAHGAAKNRLTRIGKKCIKDKVTK
jgi:hypothetical protein